MDNIKIKRSFLSIYIICSLLVVGFFGLIIIDNENDIFIVKGVTIYVDSGGMGDYITIQAAIDNASSGDTIIVGNGTYLESVIINKSGINLIGNSTTHCIIKHHHDGTNFNTDYAAGINITENSVNISGFNISVSGTYTHGINIRSDLSNSTISSNNISTSGGLGYGILIYQANINNSTFGNNVIKTSNNNAHGIYISQSNSINTIFFNNTINTKRRSNGISLYQSNNFNLIKNIINTTGYSAMAIYIYTSSFNNINSNQINTSGQNSYGIYFNRNTNYNNFTNNNISTIGMGSSGISCYIASYNNLSDNSINISNINSDGIYCGYNCNNNIIDNNTIRVISSNAIMIQSSSKNNVTNNTILKSEPDSYGIYCYRGLNTEINDNNITVFNGASDGIYIDDSTYMNISRNSMVNCRLNIMGYSLENWNTHKIETNNTINNKPVYYYKNSFNIIIPTIIGELIFANCTDVNISNRNINYGGILIGFSSNFVVNNNKLNYFGLFGQYSDYLNLTNNTINSTSLNGRGISSSGSHCNINNNNIMNSGWNGYGIIGSGNFNNISNNTIICLDNSRFGIYVYNSLNNLMGNKINLTGQAGYGIYLQGSKMNVTENIINKSNGWGYGIYAEGNREINFTSNIINSTGYGIYMANARYNELNYNKIISFNEGVYLYGSMWNNFMENNINTYSENDYGFHISYCSNNDFIENEVSTQGKNGTAFFISGGSNLNEIVNNTIFTQNYRAHGIQVDYYSTSNTVLYNTIETHGENAYGICIYDDSDENSIKNNTIETYGLRAYGIYQYQSSGNNISKNSIDTFGWRGDGIYIQESSENIISKNRINLIKDSYGIFLYYSSEKNEISDNVIISIGDDAIGINIRTYSNDNNITNNNIFVSGIYSIGIKNKFSNNTNFLNNTVSTSGLYTIGFLMNSENATIQNSTITTSIFPNSYDIKIINNGVLTAINTSFMTVHVMDSDGGILKVQNYLDIQVLNEDSGTPVSGADVEVSDDNNVTYATPGYGGIDNVTDEYGEIGTLLLTDRWYVYNNSAKVNITTLNVKFSTLNWEEQRPDVNMSTSHTETFYAFDNKPPTIPAGLMIKRLPKSNSLNISWKHSTNTINYTIYNNRSGGWMVIYNISHPQNWTFDSNLSDKTWYYYRIQSWNKRGRHSGLSSLVNIYLSDITPPTVPKNLTVKPIANDDALNITWEQNYDDTKDYQLWWKIGEFNDWKHLIDITHPNSLKILSDNSLINGTKYYFKVRARDGVGLFSIFSEVVSVIHRDYKAPYPPRNLSAETISDDIIALTWKGNSVEDVVGYNIFMNQPGYGSGGPYIKLETVMKKDLFYFVKDLSEEKAYFFVISAFDEANNTSPVSNEAWNTTKGKVRSPRVISTIPANDSVDVSVKILVSITFDQAMDISSVNSNLSIIPEVDFKISWTDKNKTLDIVFMQNPDFNETYTIKITSAFGLNGLDLEDAPFILKFTTELKDKTQTIIPKINIVSPTTSSKITTGEVINVSGNSTDLLEGLKVTVILGNITEISTIGVNGTWYVRIKAPDVIGNYTLEVKVGNTSSKIKITVSDDNEIDDDEGGRNDQDDDFNIFSPGSIGNLLFSLVICIIIVIILVTVYLRRKSKEQLTEQDMDEEYFDNDMEYKRSHRTRAEENIYDDYEEEEDMYEEDWEGYDDMEEEEDWDEEDFEDTEDTEYSDEDYYEEEWPDESDNGDFEELDEFEDGYEDQEEDSEDEWSEEDWEE